MLLSRTENNDFQLIMIILIISFVCRILIKHQAIFGVTETELGERLCLMARKNKLDQLKLFKLAGNNLNELLLNFALSINYY